MELLIFGHDDDRLPFFCDEQGIVIGNNEIIAVGGADDKRLEWGCVPRFANGVDCHVIKVPERGWRGNCELGGSGGFFDFGEFAVERGQGNAEEFGGFFFVAAAEGEGAVEVGDFLVAEESFEGGDVRVVGSFGM